MLNKRNKASVLFIPISHSSKSILKNNFPTVSLVSVVKLIIAWLFYMFQITPLDKPPKKYFCMLLTI